MSLLPSECPNCGRLHKGYDFNETPGPVQQELEVAYTSCHEAEEVGDELRRRIDLLEGAFAHLKNGQVNKAQRLFEDSQKITNQ